MEINISPSQGARFDSIVHKKPCVAKFHSPNCPHCVELEPIWKSLLQLPAMTDLNTTFLNVHSDAIQNIKSKCAENIIGVPTIMITYNNGKSKKIHNKGNDLDSIMKFIMDNNHLLRQNGGVNDKKSRRKNLTKRKTLRSRRRFKYPKHKIRKKQRRRNTKRISRKH